MFRPVMDEIAAMQSHLNGVAAASEGAGQSVDELVEQEIALLSRLQPAPEKLTETIDLFPTIGTTPGHASLLVLLPQRTLAVAGDAIINKEYHQRGQAFEQHSNADAARAAIAELVEIADIIIPGHGDWILNS